MLTASTRWSVVEGQSPICNMACWCQLRLCLKVIGPFKVFRFPIQNCFKKVYMSNRDSLLWFENQTFIKGKKWLEKRTQYRPMVTKCFLVTFHTQADTMLSFHKPQQDEVYFCIIEWSTQRSRSTKSNEFSKT